MKEIQGYFDLRDRLDTEIARLVRLHGPRLKCRPGCGSCCTELTLLPLEAVAIRQACSRLQSAHLEIIRLQAGADAGCPFLHRQCCLIYPARPIICRTHGLPAAYIDHDRETVEVSACPHNFPEDHEFDAAELLFLDAVNEQLLLLNKQLPPDAAAGAAERIAMRHLVAGLPAGG